MLKAHLTYRISTAMRERTLTQKQAGDILGFDQPKGSALVRGRLANFSVERLLTFVTALGKDVDTVVQPRAATEEHAARRDHDSIAALTL